MKITHSEVGFRYILLEIEDESNVYYVTKTFSPFSNINIVDKK